MTLSETILAGAVGGLVTTLFLPIVAYFLIRFYNYCRIRITIDNRTESNYRVFNLRMRNRSLSTLKNVIACISITNTPEDIITNSQKEIYCPNAKVERALLSWSKNIANNNLPNIDLNQGEEQDINFIRYHTAEGFVAIEIASEQGFYDEKMANKSRTLLKADRNYTLDLFITGDNFFPLKRTLLFKAVTKSFSQ